MLASSGNNNCSNCNNCNNNKNSTSRHRNAGTSRRQTFLSVLPIAVTLAVVASCVLSVEAIQCHQCNSHLDEDCIALRLATPRTPRDDQYLKECEGAHSAEAFCRKTVTTLQVSGEQRIVRSCGWHKTDLQGRNDTCFEADNEGFLAVICACFEDGCNAATPLYLHRAMGAGMGVAVGGVLLLSMSYRRID